MENSVSKPKRRKPLVFRTNLNPFARRLNIQVQDFARMLKRWWNALSQILQFGVTTLLLNRLLWDWVEIALSRTSLGLSGCWLAFPNFPIARLSPNFSLASSKEPISTTKPSSISCCTSLGNTFFSASADCQLSEIQILCSCMRLRWPSIAGWYFRFNPKTTPETRFAMKSGFHYQCKWVEAMECEGLSWKEFKRRICSFQGENFLKNSQCCFHDCIGKRGFYFLLLYVNRYRWSQSKWNSDVFQLLPQFKGNIWFER